MSSTNTPEAPSTSSFRVSIRAPDTLSLTLPFPIITSVTRSTESRPSSTNPITFTYHPYQLLKHGYFQLNHHTPRGAETIHSPPMDNHQIPVGDPPHTLSLAPGEVSLEIRANLPAKYYPLLADGESYSLSFPACVVPHAENQSRDGSSIATGTSSPLTLPASNTTTFTVKHEPDTYPDRARWDAISPDLANTKEAQWRRERAQNAADKSESAHEPPAGFVAPAERNDSAPLISLSMTGPETLPLNGKYSIAVTLTRHASPQGPPITLRKPEINGALFHRGSAGLRRRIHEEDSCGLAPDTLDVGKDALFVSLAPGESYRDTVAIYPYTEWEEELQAGETYEYWYLGGEVQWWDWGGKEEHVGRVVAFEERSQRERIVVVGCGPVVFTVVEGG